MKRYIIETDDQYIWSYEVEGEDTAFSCKLLKPHGDRKYWLDDMQDYWDWFYGEISHIEGAEINICFLHVEKEQKKFHQFYELMPSAKFSFPVKAEWKTSEIIRYFQDFRNTKQDATYTGKDDRFMLENSETIIAFGVGNFCLTNDAASIKQEDSDSKKIKPSSKKSRIKVFFPTPNVKKEKSVDTIQKKLPTAIIKKESIPTDRILEDLSAEKANSEDLQRHIERKTEGQCDTVSFRPSAHSTQE